MPTDASAATSFRATWTAPASFSRWIEFEDADDYWLRIEIPPELARYVIFKGSLSIEGISLTVAKIEGTEVTAAIIPHTVKMTNLKSLQPGRSRESRSGHDCEVRGEDDGRKSGRSITVERLVREGF